MLPPTDAGFQLYLKSRRYGSDKDATLDQFYRRYSYIIDQISPPNINAKQLSMLYRCVDRTWLGVDEDPIELLQHAVATVACGTLSDHYAEQASKSSEEQSDAREPSEVEEYGALIQEIGQWSPLQALKIIEALEILGAPDLHIVDLDFETVAHALRGKRDREEMRRRRTPLPADFLVRPGEPKS